jgi:hypothetical protein
MRASRVFVAVVKIGFAEIIQVFFLMRSTAQ